MVPRLLVPLVASYRPCYLHSVHSQVRGFELISLVTVALIGAQPPTHTFTDVTNIVQRHRTTATYGTSRLTLTVPGTTRSPA